jgi:hypothetical protein
MGATSQGNIAGARLATHGKWNDVVELQEPALGAAALRSDERTLSAVPAPDNALDRSGDVPGLGNHRARRTWPRGGGELPALEVLHEQGQRAIDDGSDIAVGNRVAQEILGAVYRAPRARP